MSKGAVAVGQWVRWTGCLMGGLAAAVIVGCLSVTGCASEPPPSPSKKEIHSDSDRFFEKMKQEEQGRGKDADAPTR